MCPQQHGTCWVYTMSNKHNFFAVCTLCFVDFLDWQSFFTPFLVVLGGGSLVIIIFILLNYGCLLRKVRCEKHFERRLMILGEYVLKVTSWINE